MGPWNDGNGNGPMGMGQSNGMEQWNGTRQWNRTEQWNRTGQWNGMGQWNDGMKPWGMWGETQGRPITFSFLKRRAG